VSDDSSDNDDNDITDSALGYISRAMPERAEEIRARFADYSVRVRLTPDIEFQPGQPVDLSPSAAFSVIRWPPIMFSLMWVLAHGAWEAMRDYGSVILAEHLSGAESLNGAEIDQAALKLGASDKALLAIDCAVRTASGEEVGLPPWVPRISAAANLEQEAVRELWFLAIVWMLLHELQHIVFKEQNKRFSLPIDEELACDKAAFDWLLSDVDDFAMASNQPADKVRGKRGMGALIALFCIVWLSERDKGSSHPPAIQRLAVLFDEIGEKDSGRFWEFAVGLIFVVDRNRAKIAFPRPVTVPGVVRALAEGLAREESTSNSDVAGWCQFDASIDDCV
jgi:hypothetical protein